MQRRLRIRWLATFALQATLLSALVAPAEAATTRERGIAIASIAKARAKAGSFKLAAQMFHEAFKIDDQEWSYLFSAGRCEQLDGQFVASEATYTRFLQVAPGGHALRERAVKELTAVRMSLAKTQVREAKLAEARAAAVAKAQAQRAAAEQAARAAASARAKAKAKAAAAAQGAEPGGAAQAAKQAGPTTTVGTPSPGAAGGAAGGVARATTGTWHTPVGWTGLVAGVVVAGVGGTLFGLASADRASLEQRIADGTDAAGRISGISHSEAVAQKAAIEDRLTTWGVVTAVGAATAAVGVMVLGLKPTQQVSATLAPTGRGLQLRWMARF